MKASIKTSKLLFTLLLAGQVAFANLPETESGPAEAELSPLEIHTDTTRNIVAALAARHFVTARLNDELSSTMFDSYLNDLDRGRNYFLAADIQEFEAYRFELDDALRRGDPGPAFHIFNRYRERVIARFEKIIALLEAGLEQFDFTRPEVLLLDREALPWAQTPAENDDLWRRRIKDVILELKLAGEEPAKIQELLGKRYTNRLNRTRQTNSEDIYQVYMNAFTRVYDPHTQYFSPRSSENFNINMSLSLEGIGAVLQAEDEYIKVVSLVPAGPADKAGQLKPNDKIIAVGQGDTGEMVDVVGWRLDEVVQLIRGKKDTRVRLDIIPAATNTGSRIIHITRNKVKLEEQSARSEIIDIEQLGQTLKIGIIDIPTFYVDFRAMQQGDSNFKSTTRDVKKLLAELVAQQVDGIVIDLRDNGGGALEEARTLTGLFIDQGPTVQIRSKRNRVNILTDEDTQVTYEGPLAVLVNRLSASASEIFAGAIQDYQRGVIIGSQTFGKGTVQTLLPLKQGQLKLTQAKFYRISGDSTQHRGIVPDILYPSGYDPDHIGESTLDRPLPWDSIPPAEYQARGNLQQLLPELLLLHQERVADNPEFNYSKEAFAWRKARSDETSISLNEAERQAEKQARDAFWVALENKKRLAQGLPAIASLDELDPEEPAVAAQTEATSSGAIVPENGAVRDQPVPGSEMVGVISGPSVVEAPATATETGEAVAIAKEEEEEEKEPDPWLVEGGQILLDLMALEARTTADAGAN